MEHALDRAPLWAERWGVSGGLVLLLDFDGTLAPITEHAADAAMPPQTRAAVVRLLGMPGVTVAVVSGRGLGDVRTRAGIPGIAYAGNHGMEIDGPGLHRVHPDALAARPALEAAHAVLARELDGVPGAWIEDKLLTLSVHYRQTPAAHHPLVRMAVTEAVSVDPTLRVTEGKMVLEVRPAVDWDKGRAVLFLLTQSPAAPGAPVLYLGDDRTDEDAFAALAGSGLGEGVAVGDPPPVPTAARSYLRNPVEVGRLLESLANLGPSAARPQPEG